MPKPVSNAVRICDTLARQLDELQRWGADFQAEQKTNHKIELTFSDGCRVVVTVSNATPVESKQP